MTRGIPAPMTRAAFVDARGVLTREAVMFLDALRSAIGGDAARTTPVDPLGSLTPVAAECCEPRDLAPVAFAGAEVAWPVGALFLTMGGQNPAALLGYGVWERVAAGRVLVGLDSGDPDFDQIGETGGSKTLP